MTEHKTGQRHEMTTLKDHNPSILQSLLTGIEKKKTIIVSDMQYLYLCIISYTGSSVHTSGETLTD